MTKIRMCVECKGRFRQGELLRLQFRDNALLTFSGVGRSFYLCRDCINKESGNDYKKCINTLHKNIKLNLDREKLLINFKEIVSKWQA